jgi:hypothetical protein
MSITYDENLTNEQVLQTLEKNGTVTASAIERIDSLSKEVENLMDSSFGPKNKNAIGDRFIQSKGLAENE